MTIGLSSSHIISLMKFYIMFYFYTLNAVKIWHFNFAKFVSLSLSYIYFFSAVNKNYIDIQTDKMKKIKCKMVFNRTSYWLKNRQWQIMLSTIHLSSPILYFSLSFYFLFLRKFFLQEKFGLIKRKRRRTFSLEFHSQFSSFIMMCIRINIVVL